MPEQGPSSRGKATYVVSICLVLAHLVLCKQFHPFGIDPDAFLVATVCLAAYLGPRPGCAMGFALGLLNDLAGSGPVGVFAMLCCAAGYVWGVVAKRYPGIDIVKRTILFAVVAFVFECAGALLYSICGYSIFLSGSTMLLLLGSAAFNALVAFVAFALIDIVSKTGHGESGGLKF